VSWGLFKINLLRKPEKEEGRKGPVLVIDLFDC